MPDSVTSIHDNAFAGCSRLREIWLSENLSSLGERAFFGCSRLTTISLPDAIASIGIFTFSECTDLETVDLPDSLQSIGEQAFFFCTKLSSIAFPDSLTLIGPSAFQGCRVLKEAFFLGDAPQLGPAAFRETDPAFIIVHPDWASGFDDITWALFTKTIIPPVLSPISSIMVTPDELRLTIDAVYGYTVIVEYSTDGRSWIEIGKFAGSVLPGSEQSFVDLERFS